MTFKKTARPPLIIALLAMSCLLPACVEDPCEGVEAPSCPFPFSVGINDFSGDDNLSTLDLGWDVDSLGNVDSYELNILVNDVSVIFQDGLIGGSQQVQLPLDVDDEVLVRVRSVCSNECRTSTSNWTPITLKNQNGGATIDPIFLWQNDIASVCSNTGVCDYIHFPDGNLLLCDGELIKELPRSQRGAVYFDRQEVCDCLNNFPGGFCNGVANIETCLTNRFLKRDYGTCP